MALWASCRSCWELAFEHGGGLRAAYFPLSLFFVGRVEADQTESWIFEI